MVLVFNTGTQFETFVANNCVMHYKDVVVETDCKDLYSCQNCWKTHADIYVKQEVTEDVKNN